MSLIFQHPTQARLFVKVIAASQCAVTGRKVYTFHMSYPRFVHGEMMTHRVFCRNARSSRAVPIMVLLEDIRTDPVVPWHLTRNQKGMQGVKGWNAKIRLKGSASLFVDSDEEYDFEAVWLHGRDMMCDLAESLSDAEYHKQVANRLVEPWMWMDLLVTSTHWANFVHLRDHEDAEPHIRDLAILVGQALDAAECEVLQPGEWHLPYITEADKTALLIYSGRLAGDRYAEITGVGDHNEWLKMVSAARCARISYKPFDGDGSFERELERFQMLIGNDAVHASPLEHQCTPDTQSDYDTTRYVDGIAVEETTGLAYDHSDLHGPLTGFIQFRKTVPNEAVYD